ncbi:MAG: cytochrome c biogenesis CcdA family protein [Microbacteriaceae bacterium]
MSIGFAGAFLGGILTLLSPCSAMLLPGFFAYAFASKRRLLVRTGVFYLGLVTTLVPLGASAGTIGVFLNANRALVTGIGGGVLIAFGILYLAGIRIPLPGRAREAGTSVLSIYLLGAAYGIAGGCAGPILGSILTIAALGGDPGYGAALLAVYAAGMAIPVAILALFWDGLQLGGRRWLRPRLLRLGRWRLTVSQLIAGLLFVAIGGLFILTEGTGDLGGVVTPQQQIGIEAWIRQLSSSVNDGVAIAVLCGVIVVSIVIGWVLSGRRQRRQRRPDRQAEAAAGEPDQP